MAAPVVELIHLDDTFDLAAAESRAAIAERTLFADVFKPRERMNVLEWSEQRRYLSPEANALASDAGGPVRYSTAVTPYHREILLALSDPRTQIVACKMPSQDGKTELLNNFVGQRMDVEPGPMLVLVPTKELAETWSKDRLAPMIRDTPALRNKVREARSRDADNTILHKKFPGGHLTAVGGNSAAGLSARPIRDVLVDEVDRVAEDAGGEGDPIRLAFRRATTFRRGKKLLISSPTIKNKSRIDKEYLLGTQEEYHVPCPHCDEYQFMQFGGKDEAWGIKWNDNNPDTAYYVCRVNGCVIEEHLKGGMIERGRWVMHNAAAFPRRRSFTKTAWCSNLVSWTKLVAEWLEIKGEPLQLQAFINTVNCELWDPIDGKEVNAEGLIARMGIGYPEDGTLPLGVAKLTRSVDTQDDRLETAVWGWGAGEEAWLIEWDLIAGDPGTPAPWKELDAIRARRYHRADGVPLVPECTFIDAGGHHAKAVYGYCRTRQRQNVYAIFGSNMEGAPILSRPTRNNAARTIVYHVGSFTIKESLMTRLAKILEPGPGYVHLPANLDLEQVQQFTREKLVNGAVRSRGRGKRRRYWDQLGRNEQIDLYVYALAGLHRLGPAVVATLGKIAERLGERAAKEKAKVDAAQSITTVQASRARPRQGFVNAWKR